ncbi:hypothetical protein MICA_1102 [Micavibrio aeruginosavorus ARL-13]|uniref:Uncharacterized protein n=1 Tax=Micavibrio aeruginosavorus (strain ARL-13) TaxID=856793 RepID=G2KN97_MICAA|nr:hypothetical protein MICA_1102 [Micavibrio aeruginosavorus ARL-13]
MDNKKQGGPTEWITCALQSTARHLRTLRQLSFLMPWGAQEVKEKQGFLA